MPDQLDEEAIFQAARLITDPAARLAYLDKACGPNDQIRRRVELLLSAATDDDFLKSAESSQITVPPSIIERVGLKVGRYKLLEQIGEGGMGTVWVAEQTDPVKRRVALKLIKPGMDSRQVLSRFEAERQALAMMDHPNIAKFIDAGMTGEEKDEGGRIKDEKQSASSFSPHPSSFLPPGRPYFVMEYVRGVPITEYCDSVRLSIGDRLKLFIPICQAVQHAHQKGIIHRDLKPSNILVCLYDGQPVPKVIDFGLAKAMHQPLTEHTLYTAHGLMVGTPLYMSPEQAEFNNLDVDTRTDIYSLGVILYELLTGTTPLEKRQFKDAAFQEILRLIKDVEPQRPSLKISTSASLPSIASQRSLDPSQLSRTVRGDLDWIVMKSLEKERSRRYETANSLAGDIERYLDNEPIQARPPSSAYRLKKFTQRNKAAALAAILVAASLLTGSIISMWQAIRATVAERQAEKNLAKAREAVQEMLTRLADERLAFIPQVEEVRLGLLQDAVTFYEGLLREDRVDRSALGEAAVAYLRLSEIESALSTGPSAAHARSALEVVERLCAKYPETDESMAILADCHRDVARKLAGSSASQQQLHDAEPHYREAIRIRGDLAARSPNGETHRFKRAETRCDFSNALISQVPRLRDAIVEAQAAVDEFQWLVDRSPSSPEYLAGLGRAYSNAHSAHARSKAPSESRRCLQKALEIFEQLEAKDMLSSSSYTKFTNKHNAFASHRHSLAMTRLRMAEHLARDGDRDAARRMFRQAVDGCERDVSEFPRVSDYQRSLALAYAAWGTFMNQFGEYDEAEGGFRKAVEIHMQLARMSASAKHRESLISTSQQLLRLMTRRGADTEAANVVGQVYEFLDQTATSTPRALNEWKAQASQKAQRARLFAACNRPHEAERWYREAIEMYKSCAANFPNENGIKASRAVNEVFLGGVLERAGRQEEAREIYGSAANLGLDDSRTAVTPLFPLIRGIARYHLGDFDSCVAELEQSMAARKGGDSFEFFYLAAAAWRKEKKDEALQWYWKGVDWMEEHNSEDPVRINIRIATEELLQPALANQQQVTDRPQPTTGCAF